MSEETKGMYRRFVEEVANRDNLAAAEEFIAAAEL